MSTERGSYLHPKYRWSTSRPAWSDASHSAQLRHRVLQRISSIKIGVLTDDLDVLISRIARCHARKPLTSRTGGRWRPSARLGLAPVDALAAD